MNDQKGKEVASDVAFENVPCVPRPVMLTLGLAGSSCPSLLCQLRGWQQARQRRDGGEGGRKPQVLGRRLWGVPNPWRGWLCRSRGLLGLPCTRSDMTSHRLLSSWLPGLCLQSDQITILVLGEGTLGRSRALRGWKLGSSCGRVGRAVLWAVPTCTDVPGPRAVILFRSGLEACVATNLCALSGEQRLAGQTLTSPPGGWALSLQSSTQEIGEELVNGVVYSISLRKVQVHHGTIKGQRWLGVSAREGPGVQMPPW